ncbi:hypothetical protein A2704_04615 [Candidatus Kaiserbacteria bacterium RIFCSPHIGHO2_01_FULL_54_36b]|uniref:Uncharacterized protein n=1 Tax=Candidatus Kaiserbacteria bacterium RIFCSPHIGHO2_01_FULL_54_36b TaxID=1798483 RepID=A0A1F6CQN9_9BACT|nr:MAG: hypothetical protein A2704_04615 [Candidatus Kaiserbacteria bacterium RIFCSPHIGHO2_01_FULL_54_36b]
MATRVALFFSLAAGIGLNPLTVTWFFVSDRELSFLSAALILFVNIVFLLLGIALLVVRRKRAVFSVILFTGVLAIVTLTSLTASEIFLSALSKKGGFGKFQNRFFGKNPIVRAYEPTERLYLHPYYFFGLSRDPAIISQTSSTVLSYSPSLFRGASPESRGTRKLAFLVGGSAAFGSYSSSNETTLSGSLNTLQDEYLVVNAANPSWMSLQEFYRVAVELIDYQPELIIALDGYNDASNGYQRYARGDEELLNAPLFYSELLDIVTRTQKRESRLISITSRLHFPPFPRTLEFFNRLLPPLRLVRQSMAVPVDSPQIDRSALEKHAQQTAERYVKNLRLMRTITDSAESKFVVVFQPVLFQHANVSSEARSIFEFQKREDFLYYLDAFREYVLTSASDLNIVDASSIFDPTLKDGVPVEQLFVDPVHLTDAGFQKLAQELIPIILRL